jgi:Domain of unknown function (DUF4157)
VAHTDDPEIDALSALPPEELSAELAEDIARRWDPDRLMQLVAARAGKGEALDHSLRARYEKKLGVDLGHVRIYTGTFAEVAIDRSGVLPMRIMPVPPMVTASAPRLRLNSSAKVPV